MDSNKKDYKDGHEEHSDEDISYEDWHGMPEQMNMPYMGHCSNMCMCPFMFEMMQYMQMDMNREYDEFEEYDEYEDEFQDLEDVFNPNMFMPKCSPHYHPCYYGGHYHCCPYKHHMPKYKPKHKPMLKPHPGMHRK